MSLKPKVLPDFLDSVESANIQPNYLTCEIPLESRNMSEIESQLHYVWYKDEIPISVDSPILQLDSYPDPVKQLSSSAIRQGTYRCVVTVEGMNDRFSSQDVNYFHSERQAKRFSACEYTCFEKSAPSSSTSHNVTFLWKTTQQTKSAVSEPMCLNDWRLITRKCRPSVVWGATWGRFDASKCTKYQHQVKEAEETCRNQSSLLADLKQLNKGIKFLHFDPFKYWLSNRGNHTREQWSGNNGTIERRNRTLLCAYRAEFFSWFLPRKCSSTENHPFVCIYQPFLLLNTFTFSKPWYKYSHKRASYYVEHFEKNWHDANISCHSFPVKSTLVQDIRSLEGYSLFKVLLRQLDQDSKEFSWWMNLFQDGDSLKWLTSPGESPPFVDWERHTDFSMNRSAGVLGVAEKSFRWSLRDLSSKQGSICEMQDLKESHRTVVYLEDRTSARGKESNDVYGVDLQCIPSGWFVWSSVFWFKDGTNIYTNTSQKHLHLTLEAPIRMAEVSEFQGYYYCSADSVNPAEEIYSPKMLIKFPGAHTFVLHMKSEIAENGTCSDVISLKLPFIEELNKYLDALYSDGSGLFLKDVTCIYPVINIYHHVYIIKDKGTEKELQNFLEHSVHSRNVTLFESPRKLDVSVKSTVSCSKETSHSNGHVLTWPETPLGQSTFPEEMCVTAEDNVLERKCLGDFYTGAQWSPVEKNCTDVQSKLIMTLHKLSQVLTSAVHTVDEIIDTVSSESKGISPKVSRKITRAVEDIALNAQTDGQAIKVAGRNIAVSVLPLAFIPRGVVLENWGSNVTVWLNDSSKGPDERLGRLRDYEVAVLLPENVFAEKRNNDRTAMAIAFRKNSLFLKNIKVISPVIDVSMETETVYDVDPPLEMIYKVSEMLPRPRKRNWGCVSWDEALDNNFGGWSYKGCFSVLIDPTHVRCYCNHLTSFAVIWEINPEYKMPKAHAGVLSVLTYIGFSLSMFGLGIVILTFSIFRKWREDVRHQILFHLSFSLMSFLLVFSIGIEKTDWEYGCEAVAVLLHFFMLATFFWMLVEAFLQYLCLVKVIGTYIPHFLRKAMLFAWGTPVIIVGIVLAVDHKLYHNGTPLTFVGFWIFGSHGRNKIIVSVFICYHNYITGIPLLRLISAREVNGTAVRAIYIAYAKTLNYTRNYTGYTKMKRLLPTLKMGEREDHIERIKDGILKIRTLPDCAKHREQISGS
ncbi:Adhesion G-protein coupled receptor G4 like protein [Argiope bruennichi]|uniref:Adhesion G-protein coupled receptor G4 like protein n=1 Tax=Argiope bruennichi TaxID=94029 RepID=A0A8T0FGK4_ARGBR|nr:Adhesion G-protein coupled receptor G4 like protein [Argiope bruennichi]